MSSLVALERTLYFYVFRLGFFSIYARISYFGYKYQCWHILRGFKSL